MARQREKEAADYLKKHKIIQLVDHLTSMLLFSRPENPREFLITQLEQLQQYRRDQSLGCQALFNESNLDAIFGILDPIEQGHITYTQYKEALTAMGISDINESPSGVEDNWISCATFKIAAKEGQERSWANI